MTGMGAGDDASSSLPLIHWYGSRGSVWNRLIDPHSGIGDPEQRRRARLLTASLLVWLAASIILTLFAIILDLKLSPEVDRALTIVFIPLVILYALAFVVSRTKYFDTGAYTVVTATEVGIWLIIALVMGGQYTDAVASMLILGVLLAALFLSIEAVIGIAIVNLGGTILLPFVAGIDATSMTLLYVLQAVAYPFIVVSSWVRIYDLQRIEKQAREMETVLDSIPDTIFSVDHETAIMGANRDARARFRHWFGDVLERGTRLDELHAFPQRIRTLLAESFQRADVDGKVVFELNQFETEGASKDFEFVINPLRNHEGGNDGYVVLVSDHTERNTTLELERKAFQQSMEIGKLEEVNQFKTQLLNTASHELRTPLTPIRVQLMVLRNSIDPKGKTHKMQTRAIEILDRNVVRMDRLVADILDVASIESDQFKLHMGPVDICQVVRHEVESFQSVADGVGATLELVGATGCVMTLGDGDRLAQVLVNLLVNAIKFTSGGTVEVNFSEVDGHIEVVVKDDGAGMSPDQIPKLFQPFTQIHDEHEEARGGSGLGLYICRGIVEGHQGTIRATSEGLGHGSSFSFRVPIRAPNPTDGEDPSRPKHRPST